MRSAELDKAKKRQGTVMMLSPTNSYLYSINARRNDCPRSNFQNTLELSPQLYLEE